MTARTYRAGSRARAQRPRPAYRLAPRRSARGRRRSRIDWDRFGRVALVLVLFVIVALYVNPISNFLDAWGESRSERDRLAAVTAENAQLHRRAAALEAPGATEREARRMGMIAPGERAYSVHGLSR